MDKKDDKFQDGGVLTAEVLNGAMEKMIIQSGRQMGKSEMVMSKSTYEALKDFMFGPVSQWSMKQLEQSNREDAKKELKKRNSKLWKAVNGK